MVGRETAVSNGAMGTICSHLPRPTCLQLDLAASQSIELRCPWAAFFPPCFAPRDRRHAHTYSKYIYPGNERCTTRRATYTVRYRQRVAVIQSVPGRPAWTGGLQTRPEGGEGRGLHISGRGQSPSQPPRRPQAPVPLQPALLGSISHHGRHRARHSEWLLADRQPSQWASQKPSSTCGGSH